MTSEENANVGTMDHFSIAFSNDDEKKEHDDGAPLSSHNDWNQSEVVSKDNDNKDMVVVPMQNCTTLESSDNFFPSPQETGEGLGLVEQKNSQNGNISIPNDSTPDTCTDSFASFQEQETIHVASDVTEENGDSMPIQTHDRFISSREKESNSSKDVGEYAFGGTPRVGGLADSTELFVEDGNKTFTSFIPSQIEKKADANCDEKLVTKGGPVEVADDTAMHVELNDNDREETKNDFGSLSFCPDSSTSNSTSFEKETVTHTYPEVPVVGNEMQDTNVFSDTCEMDMTGDTTNSLLNIENKDGLAENVTTNGTDHANDHKFFCNVPENKENIGESTLPITPKKENIDMLKEEYAIKENIDDNEDNDSFDDFGSFEGVTNSSDAVETPVHLNGLIMQHDLSEKEGTDVFNEDCFNETNSSNVDEFSEFVGSDKESDTAHVSILPTHPIESIAQPVEKETEREDVRTGPTVLDSKEESVCDEDDFGDFGSFEGASRTHDSDHKPTSQDQYIEQPMEPSTEEPNGCEVEGENVPNESNFDEFGSFEGINDSACVVNSSTYLIELSKSKDEDKKTEGNFNDFGSTEGDLSVAALGNMKAQSNDVVINDTKKDEIDGEGLNCIGSGTRYEPTGGSVSVQSIHKGNSGFKDDSIERNNVCNFNDTSNSNDPIEEVDKEEGITCGATKENFEVNDVSASRIADSGEEERHDYAAEHTLPVNDINENDDFEDDFGDFDEATSFQSNEDVRDEFGNQANVIIKQAFPSLFNVSNSIGESNQTREMKHDDPVTIERLLIDRYAFDLKSKKIPYKSLKHWMEQTKNEVSKNPRKMLISNEQKKCDDGQSDADQITRSLKVLYHIRQPHAKKCVKAKKKDDELKPEVDQQGNLETNRILPPQLTNHSETSDSLGQSSRIENTSEKKNAINISPTNREGRFGRWRKAVNGIMRGNLSTSGKNAFMDKNSSPSIFQGYDQSDSKETQSSSERVNNFLSTLPDLSFMMESKLVLPEKDNPTLVSQSQPFTHPSSAGNDDFNPFGM